MPTPLIEVTSPTAGAFDFGAVLKMQAMDKANAQKTRQQPKDPLLKKEEEGSSSDSNNGETRKDDITTVDIENNEDEQTSVPLMKDSCV